MASSNIPIIQLHHQDIFWLRWKKQQKQQTKKNKWWLELGGGNSRFVIYFFHPEDLGEINEPI